MFDSYERRQMFVFVAGSIAKVKAIFPKLAGPIAAQEGTP